MNVRVLGKYGRFPVKDAGTSSFLMTADDTQIVLDMGCSSLSRIMKYTLIEKITAVVLSHLHGDHIADFKAFTYMINILKSEGRLSRNIKIFLPQTPSHIYNDLINTKGLEFIVINDGLNISIDNVNAIFYKMSHPVETYGVRLEYKDKTLGYTADTVVCDNLIKLMIESDLVIGDACTLDIFKSDNSPHLSVKELAVSANIAKARKLLLAHLPDKDTDKIYVEAKEYFSESELAEEGKEYTI